MCLIALNLTFWPSLLCLFPPSHLNEQPKEWCFALPFSVAVLLTSTERKKENRRERTKTCGFEMSMSCPGRHSAYILPVKDKSCAAFHILTSFSDGRSYFLGCHFPECMWADYWVSLACVCLLVGSSLLWCRCNVWQVIFKPTQEFGDQGQAKRRSNNKEIHYVCFSLFWDRPGQMGKHDFLHVSWLWNCPYSKVQCFS